MGALHCRRDGLNFRRHCESRHHCESLAVWHADDVAGTVPRVDGFALRHRLGLFILRLHVMVRRLMLAMQHLMPLV